LTLITEQIVKISRQENGGLLSLGVLLAVSSSSAAMTAIIDTVNRAYGVEERRPWWKVRLTAIMLTSGVAIFILISFALILTGPTIATELARNFGLGAAFEWTWKILQWPVIFIMVSASVAFVYRFAPDVDQEWVWLTPGSVLATSLWLLASLGFKYYVANWSSYTETYGLIGAVMILLLWFYISGLVILIGAEMNVEIEHAGTAGPRRRIGDRHYAGVERRREAS
jgi:membrane protein